MPEFIEFLNAYPVIWPLFIFFARVTDVTIGTMRMILVVRGNRLIAAGLGFIEIMIWLFAVAGVLAQGMTLGRMLAYAAGFATGTLTGMLLEQRLALGHQIIRLVSRHQGSAIAEGLRLAGYMVTEVPARGAHGNVALAFVVAARPQARQVLDLARQIDPDVLCTIEDLRSTDLRPTLGVGGPPTGWRAIIKKK